MKEKKKQKQLKIIKGGLSHHKFAEDSVMQEKKEQKQKKTTIGLNHDKGADDVVMQEKKEQKQKKRSSRSKTRKDLKSKKQYPRKSTNIDNCNVEDNSSNNRTYKKMNMAKKIESK